MGILLILAQITLVILTYATHALTLSPWLTFLPAILLVALWAIGRVYGAMFVLDSFTNIYLRSRR